jgi:hypothetical protein
MHYWSQYKIRVIITSIIAGGFVGLLLGCGPLLRYKSIAVLSFELKTTEFRRFREQLNDNSRFDKYITSISKDANPKRKLLIDELRTIIFTQMKWLDPIQKITKQDARDFAENSVKSVDDNFIIGLRFASYNREPENAKLLTEMQVDYVTDTQLSAALSEFLNNQYLTQQTLLERTEATRVHNEYEITTIMNRLKEFRRIAQSYPETTRVDVRQIMSVDKGGERYMPLPSQMAALEAQIVDLREQGVRTDRDLKKHPFELSLIKEQLDAVMNSNFGQDAVSSAIDIVQRRLKSANEEWARQAYLENLNTLTDLRIRYIDRRNFLVTPTLPLAPEAPRPLHMVLLCALTAALLVSLWQLRIKIGQILFGERHQLVDVQHSAKSELLI